MDVWSSKFHLAAWIMMDLLCVFSHEVTVRAFDLRLCKDDLQVCVTDPRDCAPKPPSSIQKNLNMSCYYQIASRSVTCEWREDSNSHTESDVSLIFWSEDEIISCRGIFNPAATLNITARIKNYMMGREIWSQPHTVFLYDAVKPSQPALTVLGSAADSVDVSWRSSSDGSCQLRYRANHTHMWTKDKYSVLARQGQTLTYKINDLLPFTIYRAAVACRGESGIWSDWSSDAIMRTLDKVPSRPLEVCYRVEKTVSGGSFLLHLRWKDQNLCDPGNHILGYRVSYKPVKKKELQDTQIKNVTEGTAVLVVEEGSCMVTVTAFNTAGYGPAAHLNIDVQRQNTLPSVRNLWVSSSFPAMKGLVVQWKNPSGLPSVPPVSHFAVQWHSETRPPTGCWTTVDSFNTSTVIQDVDLDEPYWISVFPVYNQQCGSSQLLPASLQHGALMEAVGLKVVAVTKTTVTVVWVWQMRSGPIRVNRYRVMLRKDSEMQTLSLWPDQLQHTFHHLKPNTEYFLLLLADNVSNHIVSARTEFDEVPVVATATPLLLLTVAVVIIFILSRTVYKSYFFPSISSPRGSTAGKWLMEPKHQKTAEKNILDIEDFRVMDVLGEKSVITIAPKSHHSSEEGLHVDTSPLSLSRLTLKLDMEYVSDAQDITEHRVASPQPFHPDYAVNCHPPDSVFISEESRLLCHLPVTGEDDSGGVLRKEEHRRAEDETSHQRETAVKCHLCEFVAEANSHRSYQMTCETEYIMIENI